MTTRSVTLKFLVAATISLICLGMFPAFAQDTGDPVTIEKDRILISGTNISETDQRALNAILAQYDKSIYKLKGCVNGKAGMQQGTLSDKAIDKATAARAKMHAKDPHFSGWTLQIGNTSNQDIAGRTSNQDIAGRTANQESTTKTANTTNQEKVSGSKNRELVKRLTPILRKYSKIQKTG
jgi:hypothetical protein